MDMMDDFYDEDSMEVEKMRKGRDSMEAKDFAKLINKKDLSTYEMDELFM